MILDFRCNILESRGVIETYAKYGMYIIDYKIVKFNVYCGNRLVCYVIVMQMCYMLGKWILCCTVVV